MTTIPLQEAQSKLGELIRGLAPGEELIITENDRPVAKVTATPTAEEPRRVPKLGTQRGSVLSMEHFDDPLDDFAEYMR
jgi:antitoxin (DNA-binding transcriptional repressor) of toxin-antitoxin stability system